MSAAATAPPKRARAPREPIPASVWRVTVVVIAQFGVFAPTDTVRRVVIA